jgi:hypothetical protein
LNRQYLEDPFLQLLRIHLVYPGDLEYLEHLLRLEDLLVQDLLLHLLLLVDQCYQLLRIHLGYLVYLEYLEHLLRLEDLLGLGLL